MKRSRLVRGLACVLVAATMLCTASCSFKMTTLTSFLLPAEKSSEKATTAQNIATTEAVLITEAETTEEVTQPVSTTALTTIQPVTTTQPVTTQPAATKPVTTQPPTTKPVTTQPVTTKPAATKPATTKPVTTKPAATKPTTTVHVHSYQVTVVSPGCLTRGYTQKLCACGASQIINYTNPLGHSFGAYTVTKNATCYESGIKTRTCVRCGIKENEAIPKLEHKMTSYSEVRPATFTEEGEMVRHCTVCGYKETAVIPMVRPYVSMDAALELLRLVNEERSRAGLNQLTFNNTYYSCEEIRVNEITRYFDTKRPNGQDFRTVYTENGLIDPGYTGEIVFASGEADTTPSELHKEIIKDSTSLNKIIRDSKYNSAAFCVLYTETNTYVVEGFFE